MEEAKALGFEKETLVGVSNGLFSPFPKAKGVLESTEGIISIELSIENKEGVTSPLGLALHQYLIQRPNLPSYVILN